MRLSVRGQYVWEDVMHRQIKQLLVTLICCLACWAASIGFASAEPTVIRMGRGAAAEEPYWLLWSRPDLAPNYGKIYTIDMTFSPNTDKRFQALQAGALDIMSSNSHSALYAAAAGLPFKIIGSVARESTKGAHTRYFALDGKGLNSIKDLKGRTIGVVGLRSATHFWAAAALKRAGLNPQTDVTFIPLQFPVMGEALRSGTVDVGTFVEPFDSMESAKGGVKPIFTSKDGVPFEEELIVLVGRNEFLKQKPEVARAFLSDLKKVTAYYLEHTAEARKALIDAGVVRTPLELYLKTKDWYRSPDLKVDAELLKKVQQLHLELGMQEKQADIDSVVDLSYLPDGK